MKCLWEILVPVAGNDGKVFSGKHHKDWDDRVRQISGGMTICKTAKGQWISPSGDLFAEKMIPIRLLCTAEEMEAIADMTARYYSQKAVMYYRISDLVVIKHYE